MDEAILGAVQTGESLPTLRLYSWMPACLSLGYAQSVSDVDEAALRSRGWDMVRRPTGGRAILHTDELTYSVTAPDDEPRLAGGVLESYRRLSQALLKSLDKLNVPATGEEKKSPRSAVSDANPVCFEVPSDYEITALGKKLVGSAQARRRKTVLQHGSLPLTGDIARITEVLVYPNDAARQESAERVQQRAITVEGALGLEVSWQEAAEAFQMGFAESLTIDFVPGELATAEKSATEKWLAEKYANDRWTRRV